MQVLNHPLIVQSYFAPGSPLGSQVDQVQDDL